MAFIGSKNVSKLLQTSNDPVILIRRNLWRKWVHWPNDWLPFVWKRPEIIPGYFRTNDRGEVVKISKDKVVHEYENLPSISMAPPSVKKLYTFKYARAPVHNRTVKKSHLAHCENRLLNDYSLERRVISATLAIRRLKYIIMNEQQNNAVGKIFLNTNIGKRDAFLHELYRTNRGLLHELCEKYQIEFTPGIPDKIATRVIRKREIRRLTDELCESMKKKKLEDFHAELKAKQVDFEKEKSENEEFIAKKIKEFNITEEEIDPPKFLPQKQRFWVLPTLTELKQGKPIPEQYPKL